MADDHEWIGRRIGRYRDLLGLTQQELADTVGVSRSYVAMIERGERAVTKRSLLIRFASALGVAVTDLTGQPTRPRSRDDMHIAALASTVRQALDEDPDGHGTTPRPADVLARAVDEAMRARMFCDYARLCVLAPGLVRDARLLAEAGHVDGLRMFAQAAVTAAFAIKPFGYVDLATRLGERALRAAEQAGDAVCAAAARFAIAQAALAGGCRRRSYHLAESAAVELSDGGDDDARAWYGLLHLHAALSAGALGRGDTAEAHLDEAARIASHVAGDPWRMEFGPTNVRLWRVGVALENGQPERAPVLAAGVDPSGLRTPHRRARLHIDSGRGAFLAGDHTGAVRHFLAAVDIAPVEVRGRATVEEMVGQLVRSARRPGEELRTLAVRLGIDPLDPPESMSHSVTP